MKKNSLCISHFEEQHDIQKVEILKLNIWNNWHFLEINQRHKTIYHSFCLTNFYIIKTARHTTHMQCFLEDCQKLCNMIKHYFIGNSHAVLACIKNMVLLKILFINWHTEDISRLSSRLSSRRKRVAYAVFSDLIAVLLLFLLFCFTSNLHLDQTRCKISLHIFIIFIWCSITSQVDKKRIAIFWRQNFSEIICS